MATKKLKGLGRGLEALLGPGASDNHDDPAKYQPGEIALDLLQPGKYQPRTRMDEGALVELADSIKAQGLMQPILVRKLAEGRYEIIAGERRARAARLAGLEKVPVLVKDVPDEAAAAMALIENIQREDLNPLEEAQGVERLIREFGLTHEEAARAIGRSRSATSNLLRLLNLARPVQQMLLAGDMEMGHARALLAVDAATQIQLANEVTARRLSVRDTEKLVSRHQQPAGVQSRAASQGRSRDLVRLEEELSDALATRVGIKVGQRGAGKLVIDFASYEQLDGIIESLRAERLSR
ncbi:ParB/RepB/Spo0J family partition protein [Derxia gummosa]|uniref:ParB/RepB/Spo0J family partition protein n=1 Tax=Derxia gummosa DSM 723 TaxID=1121388 RepID=A0A8B6X533_9BURK|nr:ParB/RepB/Spo0J family partition protein [Derxia gummosa]